MSTLQTIGIALLFVLFLVAVIKILAFFHISTSEYAMYLLFYVFLAITFLLVPTISDPFDKND